jgi:hypothetical protein
MEVDQQQPEALDIEVGGIPCKCVRSDLLLCLV